MKSDDWPSVEAQAYGGVLLRDTGHILLREPANHFDGYVWTFAKGKPDPGETPEATALREVLEKTGYQAEVVDILPGVFHSGLSSNAYYVCHASCRCTGSPSVGNPAYPVGGL